MVESAKSDSVPLSRNQAEKAKLSFGYRLKAALGERDMAWLSRETGISTSTLSDYGRGKLPRVDKAIAIAHVLNTSVEALFGGGSEISAVRRADEDGGLVEIASIDFAYGFGGAYLDAGDPNIDRVTFSQTWLRARGITAPPELIGVAQGIGDSMEPMFFDRDMIFFDRSARLEDHMGDKVWVFAYGQVGMVKILRPLPDGTIKIISANRMYPEEIAPAEEIFIIGRVVSSWRNH